MYHVNVNVGKTLAIWTVVEEKTFEFQNDSLKVKSIRDSGH